MSQKLEGLIGNPEKSRHEWYSNAEKGRISHHPA